MNLNDPRLRKSLYTILVAIGGVLVAYGVVDQASIDALLSIIPGFLLAVGGGVAVANTPTRKHDPAATPDGLAVYHGFTSVPNQSQVDGGGYTGRHRRE